jgi:hypothetical protein
MAVLRWDSGAVMLSQLTGFVRETWRALLARWPLLLAGAAAGGLIAFAIQLSDEQGRMDLPQAYSVRMTCEDDIEAALWRGGCERIAADIAETGRPAFFDLYRAFVAVHHAPSPRQAAAARFEAEPADTAFDLRAMLAGQRHGLAMLAPEFEGVKSRAHAEAVIDAIDTRDRALLVIGRAGLGYDALLAGVLANLVHPGTMIEGAWQYLAILLGTAKRSDFTASGAMR